MARVFKRKNSSYWWTEYKEPNGLRTRRSTRVACKEELKEKATLAANHMELECWNNWSPGKKPIVERTFEELAVHYLKMVQPGRGHLDNIRRLREYFAGRVLNDLTKLDVTRYIAWRKPRNARHPDRPVSDSTLRRELGVLSAMINYANELWEWQLPNPVMGRRPKSSKGRMRWARPDQARRLISAALQHQHAPWLVDFIELGLNTGMRKMEMLACEWDRVDLANHCIHLYPEHQKNGRYGTVALNKGARRAIMRRRSWVAIHCPESPWLFPSRFNRQRHMRDVRKPFGDACEVAGLSDFRPHDLRHTFASWLVQAGVTLSELKEVMRHSDIKQTEQYAHLATHVAQRVVTVLDDEGDNGHPRSSTLGHYVAQSQNPGKKDFDLMGKIAEKLGG